MNLPDMIRAHGQLEIELRALQPLLSRRWFPPRREYDELSSDLVQLEMLIELHHLRQSIEANTTARTIATSLISKTLEAAKIVPLPTREDIGQLTSMINRLANAMREFEAKPVVVNSSDIQTLAAMVDRLAKVVSKLNLRDSRNEYEKATGHREPKKHPKSGRR